MFHSHGKLIDLVKLEPVGIIYKDSYQGNKNSPGHWAILYKKGRYNVQMHQQIERKFSG